MKTDGEGRFRFEGLAHGGYRLEARTAQRSRAPLSLVLIDIDHFKSVNDTYGHDMGDVVLSQAARVMKAQTRSIP